MGVFGLWDILMTTAERRRIEQLSGQVLAVDVSIWLVKIASRYPDLSQQLRCFLDKIVLLKRNNILPVFVFDGVAPLLKRHTLAGRRRKRVIAEDLQVKKNTEIHVGKIITDTPFGSEKIDRVHKYEAEMQQLNKLMTGLRQGHRQSLEEQLEKIQLQSQILSQKYRLFLQINPWLYGYPHFLQLDEYSQLQINSKVQYLRELEEYQWSTLRVDSNEEDSLKSIPPEQKLQEQLILIDKKVRIRQMQDQLYRKVMKNTTRIEDGYEVVEGIYGGRRVVQKRRIQLKEDIHSKKNKKMKNDYEDLISNCSAVEKDKYQSSSDAFLADFCAPIARDSLCEPGQTAKNLQKQAQFWTNLRKSEARLPSANLDKLLEQIVAKSEEQSQYGSGDQNKRGKRQFQNKDNLPLFKASESAGEMPVSADNIEFQKILKLCGIPYLIAPCEAEAQCASLQLQGLVDGVITEDSDVFLFGAKKVYRGVFQDNIKFFDSERIQQKLRLTREKMILFALLVGSDYTVGVKGIGIVNAMEILKAFDSLGKLKKFKEWAVHADLFLHPEHRTENITKLSKEEEKQFFEMHKNYKKYWFIDQDFPKQSVVEAYLDPKVVKTETVKAQLDLQALPPRVELLRRVLEELLKIPQKQSEYYIRMMETTFKKEQQTKITDYNSPTQQCAVISSLRLQKSIQTSTPAIAKQRIRPDNNQC